MATVYLHIGSQKTGTSAIQQFLLMNEEKLHQEGIAFPSFAIPYDSKYRHRRNAHFLVYHSHLREEEARRREEYTRNMAVGASFAQLSIILLDASKGVLLQTRRHARICNMMGIRHFVFAVNKMDLVGYDEKRFLELKKDIKSMMAEYEYETLRIIPVSATEGDFITGRSAHMKWYKGQPLLTYLEEIDVREQNEQETFSLPVQRVCRPNYTFRGFQGQVESGAVRVGDEICALPSGENAKVEKILNGDRQTDLAEKGNAVTICLDREIDVSRGSVLCTPHSL